MMKVKRWNKIVILFAVIALLICEGSVFATRNIDHDLSKISEELKLKIAVATEDDLIPVWIWRELIDKQEVKEMILAENGMNPDVYENSERFNSEVVPIIEDQIKSNSFKEPDDFSVYYGTDVDDELRNRYLLSYASNEKMLEYLAVKRAIMRREYIARNAHFLEEVIPNVGRDRIIYSGKYSSTLIASLTKEEIYTVAGSESVEGLDYYQPEDAEATLDYALNQVGVYCPGGTGYDQLNGGWLAYNGYGTRIGIIEMKESGSVYGGKFDSSAPQLVGNTKLHFVENERDDGTIVPSAVNDHATMVTSIIAGRSVTALIPGTSFTHTTSAGVVPAANVYQTPATNLNDMITGFNCLIDYNVQVINGSFTSTLDTNDYGYFDKELDRLINQYNITYISSAGNNEDGEEHCVRSPAKALNCIAVGNVASKNELFPSATNPPFEMNSSSCYKDKLFLPNKPDISAPGTLIVYRSVSGNLSYASGTSVSAAIVTGIVAQMIQANTSLSSNPTAIKAALLHAADRTYISTTNDVQNGNYLYDKSGAGFVNSINAVTNAFSTRIVSLEPTPTQDTVVKTLYCIAGEKIRAVMTFNRKEDAYISSSNSLDDIDLALVKTSGNLTVATSMSSKNNVEIIEFQVSTTGYYQLVIKPYHLLSQTDPPNVSVCYSIN